MIRGYPVCYIQILLVVVFSFSRGHVNILTLSSWHFYFVPLLADGLYSAVSTQLVKRSQKMMEKYRQLLFDESMVSIFVYFKAYTATCIFFSLVLNHVKWFILCKNDPEVLLLNS